MGQLQRDNIRLQGTEKQQASESTLTQQFGGREEDRHVARAGHCPD